MLFRRACLKAHEPRNFRSDLAHLLEETRWLTFGARCVEEKSAFYESLAHRVTLYRLDSRGERHDLLGGLRGSELQERAYFVYDVPRSALRRKLNLRGLRKSWLGETLRIALVADGIDVFEGNSVADWKEAWKPALLAVQ